MWRSTTVSCPSSSARLVLYGDELLRSELVVVRCKVSIGLARQLNSLYCYLSKDGLVCIAYPKGDLLELRLDTFRVDRSALRFSSLHKTVITRDA